MKSNSIVLAMVSLVFVFMTGCASGYDMNKPMLTTALDVGNHSYRLKTEGKVPLGSMGAAPTITTNLVQEWCGSTLITRMAKSTNYTHSEVAVQEEVSNDLERIVMVNGAKGPIFVRKTPPAPVTVIQQTPPPATWDPQTSGTGSVFFGNGANNGAWGSSSSGGNSRSTITGAPTTMWKFR